MRRTIAAVIAGLSTSGSLAVVTAMWASNGGVDDLTAGGWSSLVSAGRLTGLLAANLLLVQVLLMARIPVLERAFGQDRLARWHRWVGFTSFHLTIRAAHRRMRYESWHLLHLYAYLGVGLALPHQLLTGSEFTGTPLARAYWWALYAGVAGAVLLFRVGLPLWRNLRHRLVVDAVVPQGPGLTSVYIRGRGLERLPVRAGQFFLWRFFDGPGWSRAHPFSLSAPPCRDRLRITVKDVGDGSSRVSGLRPGTRVAVEGPLGV